MFTALLALTTMNPIALPSERQLRWHERDMYVLVHFTPTTFENKEWGYGDAHPAIFNPTAFDANQIVRSVKAGHFRGLILVAKHHDGFCLWPTKTTAYNISRSPWRGGKGDIVREFERACRKNGLAFGVYCSPWDRNNPAYGTPAYVETYRAQLRELYSNYGELFMSWHDGANGGDGYYGGARETRKIDRSRYYGWEETWAMTRRLQPKATIFSDVGWDVRWVGNEAGEAAETSWATFTPTPLPGKTAVGPGEVQDQFNPVGTRNGKFWMPAECDVPLRPGWFYHPEQDDRVKTAAQLFEIYLKSVGRGAALDLGIAPNRRGLLHENDVASLKEFGRLLDESFANNLAKQATFSLGKKQLTDSARYSSVVGNEFVLTWKAPISPKFIRLRENIKLGQRVDSFVVESLVSGEWREVVRGTSIGANRTLRLPGQPVSFLRVRLFGPPGVELHLSDLSVF